MNGVTLVIALGVSGLVFCLGCILLRLLDRYHRVVEERLSQLPKSEALTSPEASGSQGTAVSRAANPQQLGIRDKQEVTDSRMLRAGITYHHAGLVLLAARVLGILFPLAACLVLIQLGVLSQNIGLLAASVLGLAGFILPSWWIHLRITKRQNTLKRSLPDFLDLMIVCLQSGLSVQGTIHKVADELRIAFPMLAEELAIVQRDIDLGVSVEAAFRRFADRSGMAAVRSLSAFIRESQRFGSELVEALRSHAEMMRHQREQAAEEMAQKASVKLLFPTLLLILPGIFVVLAGPALIKIQEAFAK